MSGVALGVLGALVGSAAALLATAAQVARNRRAGVSAPLAEALGLGPSWSQESVERQTLQQGASLALPVYVVVVGCYSVIEWGSAAAGILMGTAGLVFGACANFSWRSLRR